MSDLALGERLPAARSRNRCMLALLVASGVATAWILLPLAGALFLGAVAAIVFAPAYRRTLGWWRGHSMLAAGTVTLAVVLAIGVPLAALTVLAVREVADGAATVARIADEEGTEGLIDRLPRALRPAARTVVGWASPPTTASGAENGTPAARSGDGGNGSTGSTASESAPPESETKGATTARTLPSWMEGAVGRMAGYGAALTRYLFVLLVDCVLAIAAMFCLLVWGAPLVRWMQDVLPLPRAQSDRLVGALRDCTRGVVIATFVAAAGQTIVAAVGYAIAGVGSLPFVVAVTFAGAVMPVVGGAVVTCAVGVLAMLRGDVAWGVFLFAWGVIAVNLTESVLAPWLSAGRVRLHGALVFFAMLGGMAMFGPLGIVAGPLVVAFFRTVVEIAREPVPLPVLTRSTGLATS